MAERRRGNSLKTDVIQKSCLMSRKQLDKLWKDLNNVKKPSPKEVRMRRKLHLRRQWVDMGLEPFNIDQTLKGYAGIPHAVEFLDKDDSIKETASPTDMLASIRTTKYENSFAARILGTPSRATSMTTITISQFDGRKLPSFIRRDDTRRPLRALMLQDIRSAEDEPIPPIDYCHLQPQHLLQVNELLQRTFWPGINAAENLEYPNYSVVALYKRLVIGCALMTPDAYISYVAVSSGWEGAGIGQFMLYHLMTAQSNLDLTLHVSANNNAMILYQKFGFKPEEFIVKFYNKYLPADSLECKNAMLIRLRR